MGDTLGFRSLRPDPAAGAADCYTFLLLDQFTHLAFSCAIEPLRLANHVQGAALYRWQTCSDGGQPVQASNGISVMVDGDLRPLGPRDRLVVVGGRTPRQSLTPRLLAWLRRQQAHGTRILGICGATAVLADAGVLQDQACAVHWEVSDAFAELHPGIRVAGGTFSLEGVPTAAGGAAAADLMLHLIGRDHGAHLAGRVADQMIYSGPRGPGAPQTATHQARLGTRNPTLLAVLRLMEGHLDEPLAMTEIAERAGTSVRQVERLFLRHLKESPNRHYMGLRMERARRLLSQTDLSVTEVALACGFTAPSHFSKKYRAHFGQSAHQHRLAAAAA